MTGLRFLVFTSYSLCLHGSILEGDYVDLTLVPERYTGYSGHSARRVWKAIYEENCFGLSELNQLAGKSAPPVTLPYPLTDVLREPLDSQDTDGECLEKRVYYKIISGTYFSWNEYRVRANFTQVFMRQSQHIYAQNG